MLEPGNVLPDTVFIPVTEIGSITVSTTSFPSPPI